MVAPGGGGGRTVVVADDDSALRLLCKINLELEGFEVLEAATAAELEQALGAGDVAVVLLDIHLGADDGVEVARRLRDERPDIRIAFFSGTVQTLSEEALSFSRSVISKPFTLDELIGTVRELAG